MMSSSSRIAEIQVLSISLRAVLNWKIVVWETEILESVSEGETVDLTEESTTGFKALLARNYIVFHSDVGLTSIEPGGVWAGRSNVGWSEVY